jgi:hypothetical protein
VELEEKCEKARREITRTGAILDELTRRKVQMLAGQTGLPLAMKREEDEYDSLVATYDALIATIGHDPFADPRFCALIGHLNETGVSMRKYCSKVKKHEKRSRHISKLNSSIQRKEKAESKLNEKIAVKRDRVFELERKLRELSPVSLVPIPPHHVEFPADQRQELRTDETVIVVQFRNLRLDPSLSIPVDSALSVTVVLLDMQQMSPPVPPESFSTSVGFVCRNDEFLRSFIETSFITVELSNDDTTLGTGQLSLARLWDVSEFSGSLPFTANGVRIASVAFDAGVLLPLAIDAR